MRRQQYAAWAHAGLPRRDLKDPTKRWTVSTDYATLTVSPGTRRLTEGGEAVPIGVPFGAYASLVLPDWQSEAIRKTSRHVHIGKSPSDVLKRMGLPHGSGAMRMLQEQTERLAVCTVAFSLENGGRGFGRREDCQPPAASRQRSPCSLSAGHGRRRWQTSDSRRVVQFASLETDGLLLPPCCRESGCSQ
jgi:hypothetical protein